MKEGDIVKYIGETGQYFTQPRPSYLKNAIGQIMVSGADKNCVFFLFEIDTINNYVSYYIDWVKKSELKLANAEEIKRFEELDGIRNAKRVAEEL